MELVRVVAGYQVSLVRMGGIWVIRGGFDGNN